MIFSGARSQALCARTHVDIFRYIRIDEKLATSGQPLEEELGELARNGVEVVINLALHDNPDYSLADEPGEVISHGMTYVHIPVQFDAPTEADLRMFFEAMDRHQGRRTLVHCAANKRATTFVGLYRALRQGCALGDAFAPMREVWEPNPVWASFVSAMLAAPQLAGPADR